MFKRAGNLLRVILVILRGKAQPSAIVVHTKSAHLIACCRVQGLHDVLRREIHEAGQIADTIADVAVVMNYCQLGVDRKRGRHYGWVVEGESSTIPAQERLESVVDGKEDFVFDRGIASLVVGVHCDARCGLVRS